MKWLIFTNLLILGLASALARSTSGGRIVGGQEASEIVPYQASLRINDGHYGAGVVIAERFVLTAGHCLDSWVPIPNVTIVVGTLSLTEGGDSYRALTFIQHELFALEGPQALHFDIGLIKTERSIRFYQNVQSIPLATLSPPDGGFPLVATGWGLTVPKFPGEAPPPDRLQIINLTHLANEKCKEVWGDNPSFYVSQLCAVSLVGRGTCFGDSGMSQTLTYH